MLANQQQCVSEAIVELLGSIQQLVVTAFGSRNFGWRQLFASLLLGQQAAELVKEQRNTVAGLQAFAVDLLAAVERARAFLGEADQWNARERESVQWVYDSTQRLAVAIELEAVFED